jgi:tRNA pseudouridine38-40 synthase
MRLKLTLAYDGSGFRGWAAQPGLRTVEGSVREALDAVFPSWSGLAVAGRTDAGVHAFANVASLDVDGGPGLERAAEALNSALPDGVAAVRAEEAVPDFHARFSARSRSYRYRIWRSRLRSPFEAHRSWW